MRERALRFLSFSAYISENINVQRIQNSILIHPERNPVQNNVDMRNANHVLSHDKARKIGTETDNFQVQVIVEFSLRQQDAL